MNESEAKYVVTFGSIFGFGSIVLVVKILDWYAQYFNYYKWYIAAGCCMILIKMFFQLTKHVKHASLCLRAKKRIGMLSAEGGVLKPCHDWKPVAAVSITSINSIPHVSHIPPKTFDTNTVMVAKDTNQFIEQWRGSVAMQHGINVQHDESFLSDWAKDKMNSMSIELGQVIKWMLLLWVTLAIPAIFIYAVWGSLGNEGTREGFKSWAKGGDPATQYFTQEETRGINGTYIRYHFAQPHQQYWNVQPGELGSYTNPIISKPQE